MLSSTPRLALLGMALAIAIAVPAAADTKIEKNLKLEPGGKLTVDSDAGSIEVHGTSSSGAHILLTSKDDDLAAKFEMSFEESPGEVRIVVKRKKDLNSMFGWFKTNGMKFNITVPEKTRTDLSTGGGHIMIDSLDGEANAETSGGHIEASEVTKDIHVETSGGHIKVLGAKGRVDADTSGGHVEVSFAKGNARGGRVQTSGGSITVALDPNVNLNLEASTSGGSVSTDIPVKISGKLSRSEIRGSLGAGGEVLNVSTSGGSITIRPIGNAI